MKKIFLFIFTFIIYCSCSNQKKEKHDIDPCLPGYILVVYMGEQNKPIFPTLIRTDEQDTSFYKYIGFTAELYDKNGFVISELVEKEYMKKVTIEETLYQTIKQYIIKNDTKKEKVIIDDGYNTLKIILKDKCDSITFIVDESDVDFFSNLIDSTSSFKNENLQQYLADEEYIQKKKRNNR